jgi:predicted neutral ceramidase superfamily lipid hydrolase
MADLFKETITKMIDLGIFNIFLFCLALAIFYAIIRKSKIFGENIAVNGVIAAMAAFFIFAFPSIFGADLITPMSKFFTQGLTMILFIIFGFIAASLFYPNLPGMLAKQFERRSTLYIMIALGITLFVTSGLIAAFTTSPPPKPGTVGPPTDIILVAAGVIIFIVVLIVASSIGKGGT